MDKPAEYDIPLPGMNGSLSFTIPADNLSSAESTDDPGGKTEFEPYSMAHLLWMSICMGLIILITIIGNVFVIAAIILEKNLQNVQNYLILSLGVADLMVAALVMPLALLDQVSQNWFMGPEMCEIWVSFDVICCTSSILHLVCIALDRYWAVTRIDYMHTRTARRILIMIVLSWVISVFISIPPLFGWEDDENSPKENGKCVISQDLSYTVYSTMGAFYLPLLFIIIIYCKIYRAARSRIRKRHFQAYKDLATNLKPLIANNLNGQHRPAAAPKKGTADTELTVETNGTAHTPLMTVSNLSPDGSSSCSHTPLPDYTRDNSKAPFPSPPDSPDSQLRNDGNHTPNKSSSILDITKSYLETRKLATAGKKKRSEQDKKDKIRTERERKAARTLAIITGTFVFCWLPFFVWSLVRPFCGEKCYMPFVLEAVIIWMGYFNSLLNPVIYTIFNPDFRMAFQKILFGQYKASRNPKF